MRERLELLAPEEHVLDDVEVVRQREVLVDDLDAEVGRRAVGPWMLTGLPVEEDLAAVDAVDARHALDQRGLAGAVVADERHDPPGIDLEVDLVQGDHGAEVLASPLAARGAVCRS